MVLKGNNLEIKLRLVFFKKKINQTSAQIISKWQIATLIQKRGNIATIEPR